MIKIVVNRCYGGFGLSEEAYKELGLAWDGYGYKYNDLDKRSDPRLIEVIEKLGGMASSLLAKLQVVEIPDGVDWTISEYDGWETVEEKHRSW